MKINKFRHYSKAIIKKLFSKNTKNVILEHHDHSVCEPQFVADTQSNGLS